MVMATSDKRETWLTNFFPRSAVPSSGSSCQKRNIKSAGTPGEKTRHYLSLKFAINKSRFKCQSIYILNLYSNGYFYTLDFWFFVFLIDNQMVIFFWLCKGGLREWMRQQPSIILTLALTRFNVRPTTCQRRATKYVLQIEIEKFSH